jgi:diketogulonate reductase-like aldo/keto reductase
MDITSTIRFSNGVAIPRFGLGVYLLGRGDSAVKIIQHAFEVGYRHVDTAAFYGNEESVGQAVRESGLPREAIFVTTKLWNSDHGYDQALRAFDESLRKLGLDYLDLYLIHWPVHRKRLDSWRALETILAEGRCRAIGVSNYMVQHLEELRQHSDTVPVINQIELHPYNYGYFKETVDYCRANNIVVEAYSPLTKGRKLNDPRLLAIAQKYTKSAAQLLIRWGLQQGFVVIPKSANRDRIRENAQVFDFEISDDDMATLEGFNENQTVTWDPKREP